MVIYYLISKKKILYPIFSKHWEILINFQGDLMVDFLEPDIYLSLH